MIYIPHPTFNFEKSYGGYVIGSVFGRVEFKNENLFFRLPRPENIQGHSKAISCYWDPLRYRTYSFVREDGKEFAISFVYNPFVEIIGHWFCCSGEEATQLSPAANWSRTLGATVPLSYIEFIKWFVTSVTS